MAAQINVFQSFTKGFLMSQTPTSEADKGRIKFLLPNAHFLDANKFHRTVTMFSQLQELADAITGWSVNQMTAKIGNVATLIGQGLPNKAIAKRLKISPRTVENQRAQAKIALAAALGRPTTVAEFITACHLLSLTAPKHLGDFSVDSVIVANVSESEGTET